MFLSSPLRRKCLFFFTVLSCKRSQLVLHKNKICKFHLLTPLQRRYWNKAKCMLCTLRVRKSSQKERMSLHITLLLEGKISFGLQKKKICEPSEMSNSHCQELGPTSEKIMFFSLICIITPALSLHTHLFLRFFTYKSCRI